MNAEVTRLLQSVDLSRGSPPFLDKAFTQLRKKLVRRTTDPAFLHWLDHEALPHFLLKVEAAYFRLIYQAELSPESIGLDAGFIEDLKRKDEFARLARLLARWSTEIELSVDIIERACLYNLYMKPSVLKDITKEIRKNWGMQDASLLKRCVIRILNFAASSTSTLASQVKTKVISRVAMNLDNLKATALTSLLYMFMGTSLPVALLTVLGSQATLLIGGWAAARVGENIHDAIDSYALHSRLQVLQDQLDDILLHLAALNAQCAQAVSQCLHSPSDSAKLDLSRLLSKLLVQRTSASDLHSSCLEEETLLRALKVTECDDYLLVDLVERPEGL
jgi:hypothetical protein